MRILHLDSGREMRGGQWQALRLHRGLLAAGHESLLLAREGSKLLELASSGVGVGVLRALQLSSISRGFDLVHAHDARSHTLAAMFSRVPVIVARRVAFPVRTSLLSQWKYGRAALFIAVSKHVAEQLRNAGIDESRITVVYDGVPVPAESSNGDAILVVDKETGLAARAAKLAGVAIEYQADLAADLIRARALLYLTNAEGLGSGILLAMAHGVPVIASNTGGIPELIHDGKNGILVPNDATAIADALRKADPALGRAARRTVIERFTEAHMIQATLAAYERILSHV